MRRLLGFFLYSIMVTSPCYLSAEVSPPSEGTIESDGAKIYYKRIGRGDPIIVVHGGPGHNSSYFLPQFEALAKNFELIFYDQRGSGKSYENLDFNKITVPQFANDLENLRKALNLNHFALIGHSWGAYIAAQYARKHPQHVTQLILMNPLPASSQDLTSFGSELDHRLKKSHNPAMKITESAEFLAGDLPTLKRFYGEIFKEFFFEPENLAKLSFKINAEDALQGFLVYRIFEETLLKGGYDYKLKLKEIQTPTLILHGDSDPIPLWTAKEIANLMPNAKFHILKDCGHFPHVEKPDEFLNEVSSFLKGGSD